MLPPDHPQAAQDRQRHPRQRRQSRQDREHQDDPPHRDRPPAEALDDQPRDVREVVRSPLVEVRGTGLRVEAGQQAVRAEGLPDLVALLKLCVKLIALGIQQLQREPHRIEPVPALRGNERRNAGIRLADLLHDGVVGLEVVKGGLNRRLTAWGSQALKRNGP